MILVLTLALVILGSRIYKNEKELRLIKQNPYHWVDTNVVNHWEEWNNKTNYSFFKKFYDLEFPLVINDKVYREVDVENFWRCLYFPLYTNLKENYCRYGNDLKRVKIDRQKMDNAIVYLIKDSLSRGVYYTTTYYQFLSVVSYGFLTNTNPKVLLRRFEKKNDYLTKILDDPEFAYRFQWIIDDQLSDIRYALKTYTWYSGNKDQMFDQMLKYTKIVYLNR